MSKRQVYDRIARFYDPLDLPFEHFRYRHLRPRLWAGLSGRLLDAGVGTGRNIAHYPAGADVTGIDLSPRMLERARRRAARAGRTVDLRQMDVMALDFPDDHFDGIVSTFLFCVLDDAHQLPALRELARVLKPGGQIRLLEYALSADPVRRFKMRLWAPWVRWAYGATFDRNTEQYVPAAGLELISARFLEADVLKELVLRPAARDGRR